LLVGIALACVSEPKEVPPPPEAVPMVALVSIGGFTPQALLTENGGKPLLPTVARFATHGARAFEVAPVVPAASYPAHATLLTGVSPAKHGIEADRRIGEHGVSDVWYSAVSALRVPALWHAAGDAQQLVASLDWPTTQGAAISLLLPDVSGMQPGQSWLERLRGAAAPTAMLELAEKHGAAAPEAARPGAARDAALVGIACELVAAPRRPRLLLMRLSQTSQALAEFGPGSPEAEQAFAGADRELERWLHCLRDAGQIEITSVFVVGDFGTSAVHTAIAPNAVLALARLLVPQSDGVASWEAIARSNGGSAFVYAKSERAALRARDVLLREADESGAFRVLSADELLHEGGDPEAWFGLEASPGYVFDDAATGELLRAAAVRGAGGYVSQSSAFDPGFAAWGRGIRRGIRIPVMRQTDVAPTLARLLGLSLGETEGHALVGLFETAKPPPENAPPKAAPPKAPPGTSRP
jgi:predicted AlkP superfamily pyrophosphatase or phosphodiesterase